LEDWEIDENLHLINKHDDAPTFYSKIWKSNSTPDLAFSTGDLLPKIERRVLDQLATSDHKPIKLVIDFNLSNPQHTPIPRWNYKRADWTEFVAKSEALCGNINFQSKRIGETAQAFSKAILTAALESIPRGARLDPGTPKLGGPSHSGTRVCRRYPVL
jgi:hypothetical protein